MNLFNNMDKWSQWVPEGFKEPFFEKCEIDGEPILRITSNGKFNSYGVWKYQADDFRGSTACSFSVEYKSEGFKEEIKNIYALLTWTNDEGHFVARDYVDGVGPVGDGWTRLYRTIEIMEGASNLQVELAFRWSDKGCVSWRRPVLESKDKIEERKVRLATTYIEAKGTLEGNLDEMLKVIDRAGKDNPDIICLTECFHDMFTRLPKSVTAQPVPGELTNRISERAVKFGTYIVFSMHERDGEDIYNTAVLIGRNGEIVGKYRKTHLAHSEAESGVSPGSEYSVFDTDFGRIGLLICWDQAFPETARILRLMGAEIIFIPSAGEEPLQQMARAKDNGVYVVVSGTHGIKSSRIINPVGEIVADVKSKEDGYCILDIDLNKRVFSYWLSLGAYYSDTRSIFIKERRLDTYGPLL